MIDPSSILAQAVSDLQHRMGVDPSQIAPAEWLALARAALRVADPFRDVNADAAGIPVSLPDGTTLWRLTIGANIWLDDVARFLPKGMDDPLFRRALVYACANARSPDAFIGLVSESALRRALRRFERSVFATTDEINLALNRLFSVRPRSTEPDPSTAADWASLCARLETQTGIPAHDWCWKHSGSYALKAYNDLHDFAAAYARLKHSRFPDDADRALEALQLVKVAIRNRIHPPTGGAGGNAPRPLHSS